MRAKRIPHNSDKVFVQALKNDRLFRNIAIGTLLCHLSNEDLLDFKKRVNRFVDELVPINNKYEKAGQ